MVSLVYEITNAASVGSKLDKNHSFIVKIVW